jgi:hypothetical protein
MFQPFDPLARKQLIEQAFRCRRLAAHLGPTDIAERLLKLAEEYEAQEHRESDVAKELIALCKGIHVDMAVS